MVLLSFSFVDDVGAEEGVVAVGEGDFGFFQRVFELAEEGAAQFGVVFDLQPDPEFALGAVEGEVVDAEAGGWVF